MLESFTGKHVLVFLFLCSFMGLSIADAAQYHATKHGSHTIPTMHSRYHFWYATIEGGANWRNTAPLGNGDKSFLVGPVAGIALGYQFNQRFRADGEFNFRQTALGTITDTLPGPLTAEEGAISFMLNGYYTPVTFNEFSPFVGAGVGYASALYSIHINLLPPPSFRHVRYKSNNIAYQLMGGINYTISNGLRFGVEYKYFTMPRIHYQHLKSDYDTNEVLFQVAYLFNQTTYSHGKVDVLTIPRTPLAQHYYVSAETGLSVRNEEAYGRGTKAYHLGPMAAFALGYNFTEHLRLEAEIGLRQNEVRQVSVPGRTSTRPSGDETIMSYMVNGYLSPLKVYGFMPYVGAGIGYANDSYAIHDNLPPNTIRVPPTFPTFKHPRRDHANFVYQLMLGVSHSVTHNILVSLGYRYYRMNGMEYVSFNGAPPISDHATASTYIIRLTYLFGGSTQPDQPSLR